MALVPLIFLVAIATLGQATPRKSQETDQFAGVGSSPESKSEQPDLLAQAKAEAMAIAGRSNPETSSMFFQPKNDDYMPWGQY